MDPDEAYVLYIARTVRQYGISAFLTGLIGRLVEDGCADPALSASRRPTITSNGRKRAQRATSGYRSATERSGVAGLYVHFSLRGAA